MEAGIGTSGTSSVALLAGFILAALSYQLLGHLRRRFTRRRFTYPLPPAPRGVPLLGNLPFLQPKLHSYFAALATKHGPIFRLRLGAKTGIVISSHVLAREVLRNQDLTFANRDVPAAARAITYGGLDVAWTPHGADWRMRRKVCVQELLAGHAIDAVYGLRRQGVRAMLARVAAKAAAGEAVNIGTEMFAMTMTATVSMLWGGGTGSHGMVSDEFKDLISEIMYLLALPNVSDFYPWLERFDLQGIERKMIALRERFDCVFEPIIAAKQKKRKCGSGGDFLDNMLQRVEECARDGKGSFTTTNVKALLMDMVTGGTDTTSNTIEFVFAEMMNRPDTIQSAQAELDEAIGRDRTLEEADALRLPYLSAAIKEGLRLHPVLPLLVPHRPSEDCVVGGYTVPADSCVFINAWAIHRDPAAWEDPLAYRPERFLDDGYSDSGRRDFSGNDLAYIPFGSGRRMCVGVVMAERILAHALGALLHGFDWEVPEGDIGVDLEEKPGITLRKKKPLLLIPKLRLSNPDLYRE